MSIADVTLIVWSGAILCVLGQAGSHDKIE
jgi:hypothetical protein